MQNIAFWIPFVFSQFTSLFSLCSPSIKQCGCAYQQPNFSRSRIVGGNTARKHSWPWIVSIRQMNIPLSLTDPGTAICGGTLISDKYVVTAAHCLNRLLLPNYFVVIGAHYINDTNPIRFRIKSVRYHEKYDNDLFLNDIALLELSDRVDLNDQNIGFICLPSINISSYPYESMQGVTVGWGRLGENSSTSYTLQQVQLPIISNRNQFCQRQISDSMTQFCAGFIQGEKDTCQGDSGGPLMIYDANTSTYHIAGITSYGYGCALPGYPGVYTRMNMFINWIDQHMHSSSSSLRIQLYFILIFFYIKTFLLV